MFILILPTFSETDYALSLLGSMIELYRDASVIELLPPEDS